jgi:hypothetical protein
MAGAVSTSLAAWRFDVSGAYHGLGLAAIGLRLRAAGVSWAV